MSLGARVATRTGSVDREYYQVAVGVGWMLLERGRFSVSYAPEVIPIAASTNNVNAVREKTCSKPFEGCDELEFGTALGVGLVPIGLRLELRAHPKIRLRASGSAGLIWFHQRLPDPAATRLNATLALGGAIDVRITQKLWMQVGYYRHHLSNAGQGNVNPALDANLLMIGIQR
jgi:hypothetical protein